MEQMTGRSGEIEYQKEVTLNGETYVIHLLMPSKAFKLSAQLFKLLGEPLAALAGASGDVTKVSDLLPQAVRMLAERMDEDRVWNLIKSLLETVTMNNKTIPESHYQGRLDVMLKLVKTVVEVQFKDFFKAISQSIAEVKDK